MYLLELLFENSEYNGDGSYRIRKMRNSRSIAKWTRMPNERAGRELLWLTVVALGGKKSINGTRILVENRKNRQFPLRVAYVLARHYPLDTPSRAYSELGSGVEVDTGGRVVTLKSEDISLVPSHVPARKLAIGKRHSAYFLLGYGAGYRPGPRREDFNFTNPLHRLTRFHSLLIPDAPARLPV